MPGQKPSRVILDTNIWISFLIGKELQSLKDFIVSERVKLIITDQLLDEIRIVTLREKLRKYFDQVKVVEFIAFLEIIAVKVELKKIELVCRDPKDDFLLALCKAGEVDFLVTGDKDLLEMKTYARTQILTVKQFSEIVK